MLTLGPLLVGVGLLSTSYLLSLPGVTGVNETLGIKGHLLSMLPFITTSTAFTLLYIVVPNCHVSYRHSVIGGITAAAVFEFAKFGFGIYVRSVPAEAIYGAIAVIPLFLIWIYTSWVVVLLGAHITFCLSEFRFQAARSGRDLQQWSFTDAYQLVAALWDAQKDGGSLSMRYLRRHGVTIPQHQVNEVMEILRRANWVERTGSGDWILSRDLDDVTLLDLHRIIPRRLPVDSDLAGTENNQWLAALRTILEARHNLLVENLQVSLGSLLRNIGSEAPSPEC
jgi:membrane protein